MIFNTLFLGFYDLVITPLYFIIFTIFVLMISASIKEPRLRKVFFWGLMAKVTSAIIFGIIYEFVYGGGDTSAYWLYGTIIGNSLWESPMAWIKLIGHFDPDPSIYKYVVKIIWYQDPTSYFPCRIVGILAPFCFNTYSTIAIFFAAINFSGLWALYKTLRQRYPAYDRELIISIFWIPSIVFWGSGILKDGITLSALGWLFHGFYEFFINKKFKFYYVLVLFIASWVLVTIKLYILLCFLPCVIVWLMLDIFKGIKNRILRKIISPLFFVIVLITSVFITKQLSQYSKAYSFDNIVNTSQKTSSYIQFVSETTGGAAYNIGKISFEPGELAKLIPLSINVSLFRPYLWESKNVFMLLSAAENSIVLLLTLQIIFIGRLAAVKIINQDLFILFCILFSLSFAFAIGISTNNFGALVRYKIPILPFFVFMLLLLRKRTLASVKTAKRDSLPHR